MNVCAHCYPTGPYELNETGFQKIRNLVIDFENYLFKNLVVFDFESITVHDPSLNHTASTNFIGKHVPVSVSIHCNLISNPFFICDVNPRSLVVKFLLELLDLSKRNSMELSQLFNPFLELIQKKLKQINTKVPEKPDDEDMEEEALSLKLLRRHKHIYMGIKLDPEIHCKNLLVFPFNNSRYDLNFIKEYLPEHLSKGFICSPPPTVIKTCNKFVAKLFMSLQFLDNLNFLGGATSFD